MKTLGEERIQNIVDDPMMSREIKIERLRHLEDDARALQRAASESAMNSGDGWQADLRLARMALEKLGAKRIRKGAASL